MATQYVNCPQCNTPNDGRSSLCTACGTMLPNVGAPMQQVYAPKPVGADKKIAAGICGIVLGGFGIHKFILGYQQEGIIMLSAWVVSFIIAMVTCGIGTPLMFVPTIVGIIEGIIYLTKSDEEFVQTYIYNKKPWF